MKRYAEVTLKRYCNDILRCFLRCVAFQSHIQNRWTRQHGKFILQEAQTVGYYSMQEVILFYLLYALVSL